MLCWICGETCTIAVRVRGTAATFIMTCVRGHRKTWCTQPFDQSIARANFALAASLLYAGCNIVKVINLFKFAEIPFFCYSTFLNLQKYYFIPAIQKIWKISQLEILKSIRDNGQSVTLGGDGRCDSPGHCAKYGTYTLLDVQRSQILTTNLVQVS